MKSFLQSKTIWFNVLTVLVAIIGQVTNTIPLGEGALKIFGVILSVGNIILRFITTQPISTSTTLK